MALPRLALVALCCLGLAALTRAEDPTFPCPKAGITVVGTASWKTGPELGIVANSEECSEKCAATNSKIKAFFFNTITKECSCSPKCLTLTYTPGGENVIETGVPRKLCPTDGSAKFNTAAYSNDGESYKFVGSSSVCAAKCAGFKYFFLNVDVQECTCAQSCFAVTTEPGIGIRPPILVGFPKASAKAPKVVACPKKGTFEADLIDTPFPDTYDGVKSASACATLCKGSAVYWWAKEPMVCRCASACTGYVAGKGFRAGILTN